MKFLNRILAVVVFIALASPAFGQREWTYSLTPTAWGVGLDGAVSLGAFTDEVRVTYTDGFGGSEIAAGLGFEANNGRFGYFVEGLTLDVSNGGEAPSILTQTVESSLDHQIWHAGATYRLRKAGPVIDAVVGVRYFDVDTDIKIIEGGDAVVKQGATSEDWIDVTFGARLKQDIGKRWVGTGYLDFGVGDSALSYQLILGAGYKFSSNVTGNFGYRLISTDYQVLVDFEGAPPPGLKVNQYHYSSMKLAGLYANVQFNW